MNASSLLMPHSAQVSPPPFGDIVGSIRPAPDALAPGRRNLTTAELAAALSMREQSIRKRLSQTGSFWGLRPVRLPSGKLRWPADSVERLIAPSKSSFEGGIQ